MKNKITFITGNSGKAEQLSKYLNYPIDHQKIDLVEVQSVNLEEVVAHKVKEAYSQIKSPVLVDDVSLSIDQFGKLPGPFIKWFIQEMGNSNICKLAQGQSAIAEVAIAFYDIDNLHIFTGIINGQISDKPRGTNGFGWDEIFIPEGHTKTRAEMEEKEYDETSPRKIALEKLKKYLDSKLSSK